METIGCTSPFASNNKSNICKAPNESLKAKIMEEDLMTQQEIFNITTCPYPCKFINLKLVPTVDENDPAIEFNIKFERFIRLTRSYYNYGELEMIAEFGGYVGLFLGFSFLHIGTAFESIVSYYSLKP